MRDPAQISSLATAVNFSRGCARYLLGPLLLLGTANAGHAQDCGYLRSLPLEHSVPVAIGENTCALIPELRGAVEEGVFQAQAQGRLGTSENPGPAGWLDRGWYDRGARSEGDFNRTFLKERGFPYRIVLPSKRAVGVIDKPEQRGTQILWNIEALWYSEHALEYRFSLETRSLNSVSDAPLRFLGQRFYPKTFLSDDTSDQLFRERISLESPAGVKGYRLLTFRLLGDEEDLLWIFSPALGRSRQLTGSNRSDALFRTPFALDDMFGWSAKPELVSVRELQVLTALAPFADVLPASLSGQGTCLQLENPAEGAEVSLGKGARPIANLPGNSPTQVPARLPASTVMVPRPLFRLELSSKDPYALTGRQVLYVDAETYFPFFKIVYDRGGNLWKIVTTAFGVAQDVKKQSVPYVAYSLISDVKNRAASVLSIESISYCGTEHEGLQLRDLDPRNLDPKPESSGGVPAASPGAEASTSPSPAAPENKPAESLD